MATIIGKYDKFGNVSGTIDASKMLAIEIGTDFSKTINYISASFRVPTGETLVTKPFLMGCVVVVRGSADSFNLQTDFKNLVDTSNLESVRFFNTYSGFSDQVYIQGGKSEKLSVLLFAPYLQSDVVNQQACYGSLSVFGSFGQEKQLFEIV